MNNGVTQAISQVVHDLTRVTGREAEGLASVNTGAASDLREGLHRVEGASDPLRQRWLQEFEDIYGPSQRSPSSVRRSAEGSISAFYGELYRTDSSGRAGQHAVEMMRAPQEWHRLVRESMGAERYHRRAEDTYGGIWVGDAHILDLGHPVINRDYQLASQIEGAGGLYHTQQRALLVGNGEPDSHNGPLHELGHAADFSMGRLSRLPNYQEVHETTIRALDNSEYEVVRDSADKWRHKPTETWAEGFGWFYGDRGSRPFLGSEEASDPMWRYFLGADRWVKAR